MTRIMPPILRRLRADTDGSQTVALAVIAPLLLTLCGFVMDVGLLMVRNVMLERAVDVRVRDIRLGKTSATDYDNLRKQICAEASIIPECETRLKLQLTAMYANSWQDPGALPDCESLKTVTYTPPREFDTATSNQLVVLRACAVVEPVMPGWGLGEVLLTSENNRFYQVSAATSYTQE